MMREQSAYSTVNVRIPHTVSPGNSTSTTYPRTDSFTFTAA